MFDLGIVKGSGLCGAVETDDILDAVEPRHGIVGAREESAALERVQLAGVRKEVVENLSGDAQVRHVRWSN